MKCIVLTADDYGQAPAISNGILRLLAAGRLSAVSCMTDTPFWREHANWLTPYQGKVDIGLHFNLTSQASLFSVMGRAVCRRLDPDALALAWEAQLEAFEQALGRAPDFIDGHQHVHHFPQIRDALIAVYQKRFARARVKPYVRLVNIPIKATDWLIDFKKVVIYHMGVSQLQALLEAFQIPFNSSFSGIYSFTEAERYSERFPVFLQQIQEGGIIMCHPGDRGESVNGDSIAYARVCEQQYFLSDTFVQDLIKSGCRISRFRSDK